MKRHKIPAAFAVLFLLALALPAVPAAAAEQKEIAIDYKKTAPQRGADRRPEQRPPAQRAVPDSLRIQRGEEEREERDDRRAAPPQRPSQQPQRGDDRRDDRRNDRRDDRRQQDGSRRGNPTTQQDYADQKSYAHYADLERRARSAAAATARALANDRGVRGYYRAGFRDAMEAAIDDRALGRWDYENGRRNGRDDPEARRRGEERGYDAASHDAHDAAYAQVEAQFRDLRYEPRRDPRLLPPSYGYEAPSVRAPELRDVFADYPVGGVVRISFSSGLPEPWQLYRQRRYSDFYDHGWTRADEAFRYWCAGEGRSLWNRLDPQERSVFQDTFLRAYAREVYACYTDLQRAYGQGYEDGWRYGAEINYAWSYRRGYHEGFQEGLRQAAHSSYERAYRRLYQQRYDELFDEWLRTPKLELGAVSLVDDNDDGIFEPGEGVRVYFELINYGGAGDRLDVRLDGRLLERSTSRRLDIPRRAVLRDLPPLGGRLEPRTRPHSEGEMIVTVAGLERRLPLRVNYPLELARPVRLDTYDALGGRAVVEVAVANRSRRAVPGRVEIHPNQGWARPAVRELPPIAPGASVPVRFEVEGVDPLDLLGGSFEMRIAAASHDTVQDEIGYRVPELAADLGSDDLLHFMVQLARAPRVDRAAVDRAQELMLRRLRVDWNAVVERDGNPYKDDYKDDRRSTALGALVNVYRSERRDLRHREVFTALAPRIDDLAEDLPGAHPFLRRWMKRLGERLES